MISSSSLPLRQPLIDHLGEASPVQGLLGVRDVDDEVASQPLDGFGRDAAVIDDVALYGAVPLTDHVESREHVLLSVGDIHRPWFSRSAKMGYLGERKKEEEKFRRS